MYVISVKRLRPERRSQETSPSGVDVRLSLGGGYTLGNPRNFSSSALGGWQAGASFRPKLKVGAGGGLSIGSDIGYDDVGKKVRYRLKLVFL